jgi:glycosyltransferase involved in cell wall biosynthesis
MAVGLPIVSTDVQGAGEAIRHEQDGLLVPRRDPVAFGDAIGRLLRDRELAARLGASAKERFLTEYTAERMVSRTEALYRDLLARRRR